MLGALRGHGAGVGSKGAITGAGQFSIPPTLEAAQNIIKSYKFQLIIRGQIYCWTRYGERGEFLVRIDMRLGFK